MSSNRYINVTPRTPGSNLGLPSNRILLTNPDTGNVVQRIAASRDEKWVFNTKTKRFNLIPKNRNAPKKPIRRNVRIENAGLMNINLRAVNKVFPEPKNTDVRFSPLRPSLFGLKVKFQKDLGFRQFSDLAYEFAKKPFPNGVTRVVIRGDRFRALVDIKTREQQNRLNKNLFKIVRRIDVNMGDYNIQIFRTGMLMNGGYEKNPIEVPLNNLDGRKIFGKALDTMEDFMKKFVPTEKRVLEDFSVTNFNADFFVNQIIVDPFVATANGNEIYKSLKKAVLGTPSVPNRVAEFIPDFEYEFGNKNSNFMQELRELGGKVPKFPDNIYLKFPGEKGKDKKRGGSYVSWKKGYIRLQGVDSLTKVLLMVRTIQIWYDQMKRNNPNVLVTTNITGAKVKKAKKIVATKENIEKVGRVRLNVYKGKDGTNKLKLNDIRCEDTTKKGYTTKQLRVIAARRGIPGADKLKREILCEKLLALAKANRNRAKAREQAKARRLIRPAVRRIAEKKRAEQAALEAEFEAEVAAEFNDNISSVESNLGLRKTPTPVPTPPRTPTPPRPRTPTPNSSPIEPMEYNENWFNKMESNMECVDQLKTRGYDVRPPQTAQQKGEALLNNMIGSPNLNRETYQKYKNTHKNKEWYLWNVSKARTNYMNSRREFGINAEPTRRAYAQFRALKNLENEYLGR